MEIFILLYTCKFHVFDPSLLNVLLYRLGQGREKTLQYIRENPTICDEIEKVCFVIGGEITSHCSYSLKYI